MIAILATLAFAGYVPALRVSKNSRPSPPGAAMRSGSAPAGSTAGR